LKALKDAVKKELKKEQLSNWIATLYKPVNSIIGSIKGYIKKTTGDVDQLTKSINNVSGSISKGIGMFPAVASIFTTTYSGIAAYWGRFKEIKALMKLQKTHKEEKRKGKFSQAVAYGVKKSVRGAVIGMINVAISVLKAIVTAISAIVAFIGLFVPWLAIAAAALAGLATAIGLAKMAGGVVRKAKGIIKFVKGKRGKNRAKNAAIIVDTARGKVIGDASEKKEAATLIATLKPDGLADLLTSKPAKVLEELNLASEPEIDKIKMGMAEKLKSS